MMHRSYQPYTPANSKLLIKRWDQTRYDYHRKQVTSAKAMVDNSPPKTFMHVHYNMKKQQIEHERLTVVERDNHILMDKMSCIMRASGSKDYNNDYLSKSLTKAQRQRELVKIAHENQAMLKRIMNKQAHSHHSQWANDWRVNQQYSRNITTYPTDWKTEEMNQKVGKASHLPRKTTDPKHGRD